MHHTLYTMHYALCTHTICTIHNILLHYTLYYTTHKMLYTIILLHYYSITSYTLFHLSISHPAPFPHPPHPLSAILRRPPRYARPSSPPAFIRTYRSIADERAAREGRRAAWIHAHRTTKTLLAPGVEGRGSEEWGGGHGAHGGSSGGHAADDEESVRKMSGEPR